MHVSGAAPVRAICVAGSNGRNRINRTHPITNQHGTQARVRTARRHSTTLRPFATRVNANRTTNRQNPT